MVHRIHLDRTHCYKPEFPRSYLGLDYSPEEGDVSIEIADPSGSSIIGFFDIEEAHRLADWIKANVPADA